MQDKPPEPISRLQHVKAARDNISEELIFDKAEQAERMEQLRAIRDKLTAEVKELEGQLKKKLIKTKHLNSSGRSTDNVSGQKPSAN